ncbi:uncharacterized protein LOC129221019 [Uloborus diversus]|uniref:uncharacterized protein LOC129221019 n=1 Tax=Uloborus diversus TaxID=327109 RepID=UPI00240970D2|nr:uncharacterized protein LOC129221019 [Uloborus diversus]
MIDNHTSSHAMETSFRSSLSSETGWARVFKDGSILERSHGVEAGIHRELFSFYLPMGPLTTAFDGEVEAITVAVQHPSIRAHSFERSVLTSGSKSVLQAFQKDLKSVQRILECWILLKELAKRISL